MNCRDAIEVLDDVTDGTLPAALVAELDRHLDGCEPCRAYLATYRRARALGAAAARVVMPQEMRARLGAFLVSSLRTFG
jgi:anti-sigma factor RsiW